MSAKDLPETFRPEQYDIHFIPALQKDSTGQYHFEGSETIMFRVLKPASEIVLHARGLTIDNVVVSSGESEQTIDSSLVRYDAKEQTVSIPLPYLVNPGPLSLSLHFSGNMKKGKGMYRRIIKEFGKDMLLKSGQIERRRLAAMVFKDRRLLDKLCAIVHPKIRSYVREYIKKTAKKPAAPGVIIDAPLLVEAGMHKMVDILIVVKTSVRTQIERTRKRTGLASADIKRRIQNQIPLKRKIILADYVIDNEGTKRDTQKIVSKIWKEIGRGRE